MASGTWSATDKPIRPGFYMNFEAAALSAIQAGTRGYLAIPVKANWGPAKQIVEITSEKELIDTYNTEKISDGYTAYECIRLALLGAPKTVLAYRLADSSAAKASITLKDTATTPVNVLTLTTKYETTRSFNITVRDNIVDPTNKQDIVLYEGTKQLYVFTYAKGLIDNAISAINNDSNNVWIVATKLADGSGTLANVTAQSLTGGNAGIANITNQDYIDAMAAFETRTFDTFTLDGMADPSLQTSVKSWVERLRNEGKGIIAYLGGTANDDKDITVANARSESFNYEGVVNVGVSAVLDGTTYSSAQVACYVAGLAAGQALSESLTYAVTPFDDVQPRLTNNQVISAIQSGTLVLVHDGEKVKIEKGINTLTSLRESQNNAWKKIKCIRIMDAINTDTSKTANDSYVGKILNNEDGQVALLSAIKKYFETIAGTLIDTDFTVAIDKEKQANAEGDEFYWYWDARVLDSMERIFGTGIIRY